MQDYHTITFILDYSILCTIQQVNILLILIAALYTIGLAIIVFSVNQILHKTLAIEAKTNSIQNVNVSVMNRVMNAMSIENSSINNNFTITVNRGQQFVLTLESNPTTGYEWLAVFNKNAINSISHKYEPPSLSPTIVGQSGKDIFTFKALTNGTTALKMLYKREWEREPIQVKEFLINIK
jgi:inhibitor of cysteine peptidase